MENRNQREQQSSKNVFYPFFVSERDGGGVLQKRKPCVNIHGFGILANESMFSHFFPNGEARGRKSTSTAYEIRVRSNSGEWQDWQAIADDFQVVSLVDWNPETDVAEAFAENAKRFRDNFQIRPSGLVMRVSESMCQILDEESGLIKYVDPDNLAVRYYSQVENLCYPLEDQIEDMVAFRKKYHAYDESDNRL